MLDKFKYSAYMNSQFNPHSNDSTGETVLLIPPVIDEKTGQREALQPGQDATIISDRSKCKVCFYGSRVHALNVCYPTSPSFHNSKEY